MFAQRNITLYAVLGRLRKQSLRITSRQIFKSKMKHCTCKEGNLKRVFSKRCGVLLLLLLRGADEDSF